MVGIYANGLRFEVNTYGPKTGLSVLLINGLGLQLINWPKRFVSSLVDAGYYVILFDNRDVGLSQKFTEINYIWYLYRLFLKCFFKIPLYTLTDMAQDSVEILRQLNIDKAHVIGVSLGGMIAQRIALHYPSSVYSITCIMSAAGGPQPNEDNTSSSTRHRNNNNYNTLNDTLQAKIESRMKFQQYLAGPDYPEDEETLRDDVSTSILRNQEGQKDLDCIKRQYDARMADDHRKYIVHRITTPTLILHGEKDPRTPVSAAYDLHQRIQQSKLVIIPGMGHSLPTVLVPTLVQYIIQFHTSSSSTSSK